MSFNHASHIDARGSNLSNVGRDHNVVYHTINITIAGSDQTHTPAQYAGRKRLRNDDGDNLPMSTDNNDVEDRMTPGQHKRRKLSPNFLLRNLTEGSLWPITTAEDLAEENCVVLLHHSGTCAAVSVAVGLVIKIIQLLVDRGETRDDHRTLELELESLRQTLALISLAINTYECTPLGPRLVDSMIPEVEQICIVLQKLFDRIEDCRQGLSLTSLRAMWRRVWWRCEPDELASLRTKLYAHQRSLGEFLMALNSIQWMELGNELRAGRVSLRDFRACLRQGPLSLRHIQVDKVLVVDHLGRNIPVPTMFCSTWKAFDYIINGYCKDRLGNRFVERGDYQVLRAEDSQMIDRSEFAKMVEPGMLLEMTIVMRQNAAFHENKGKCPRCRHMDPNATITNGWIECCKCSGQFQIAEADLNNEDNSDESGEVRADQGHGAETRSPAARAGDATTASSSQRRGPGDDDGTSFFRRIHVVCMNNSTMSPGAMPNRKHIYGHENLQDISNLAVTATASAHAGSSMLRPLNVTNALSYLDAVKTQFCNEPNVYDHFLDIMVDFKKEIIDTSCVIDRMCLLFNGYPALIQGFNTFLPPDYRIDMSPDTNAIRVTTPDIWIDDHSHNRDIDISELTSSSSHSPLSYGGSLAGMHGTYEMPVARGSVEEDVDDKTYCFCDGVSYGEMIACDEFHCEREWFHLACVGLTTPPDGAWFCEVCKAKLVVVRE